jgi:hypothetical protein
MKYSLMILAVVSQLAAGQGWQQFGPDSVNWRVAYYLTGRWLSNSTFHLAVSTSEGVAIYTGSATWNYTLRHIPEGIANNGVSYAFLEFSPWEANACFVGHYIAYVEADLHITKVSFPPSFAPVGGGAHGPCWLGPLSLAIPPNNDSAVFAGLCGIQKSTDRGATWQSVLLESPVGTSRLVAVDASNPNIAYRCTEHSSNNALYRSTNSGARWDSLFAPLPSAGYSGRSANVVAHGDTILLGMRSYPSDTSSTGAIMRSLNGGVTWSPVYTEGRVMGLAPSGRSPSVSSAAVTAGIIQSTDWGSTWTTFNNGLPTSYLTCLVPDPYSDTIYVSTTTHGVLKTWRFTTEVGDELVLRPEMFALYQNYPNPFNPVTTIFYDLPRSSHVVLAIYDVLGRQVSVLVDGVEEAGRHQRLFDASSFTSGIYFYRLSALGSTQIRKITLLK